MYNYRNAMDEQTSDIEVTVKTLDSQSRTYTVGAQVNESFCFKYLDKFILSFLF